MSLPSHERNRRQPKLTDKLIGFASEEDWFDYQLESDPRFARRIEGP